MKTKNKLHFRTSNILYKYAIIITNKRYIAFKLLLNTYINILKMKINVSEENFVLKAKRELILEAQKAKYRRYIEKDWNIESQNNFKCDTENFVDQKLKKYISSIMSLPRYRLFGGIRL